MKKRRPLAAKCIAELIGTFILVFFGVGSVHAAILTGAQSGIWQVAIVWGIAISLAIYTVGALSGAHINPAITLAFAACGGFPKRHVLPYWLSQVAGAFLAAAVLYFLFNPFLRALEHDAGVTRGGPRSELSAMCYGEYFPNPALFPPKTDPAKEAARRRLVPVTTACVAEAIGTMFLALFVFALIDRKNANAPGGNLAAVFIGVTISILISIIAPITQAGFNPARDFGPRLFAWLAGWGSIAIPGPRGGFFLVYILSPCMGALAGVAIYRRVIGPCCAVIKEELAAEENERGVHPPDAAERTATI